MMIQQQRTAKALFSVAVLALLFTGPAAAQDEQPVKTIEDLHNRLNSGPAVAGRESAKSYAVLFEAYLQGTVSRPPFPISSEFNLTTIHPGMRNWDQVVGWAEENGHMAEAILRVRDRSILGLPYGTQGVRQEFISADLVAELAPEGDLRNARFPYLDAADVKAAYVTAEVYRLMEAGQIDQGLDLAVAHLFVVRQYCDREMYVEKSRSMQVLSQALANLRDVFYVYRDRISDDQYTYIATTEIPFLRPDRNYLFMPEGDRWLAEVMIRGVFDHRSQAIAEKLAETFAVVQAQDMPLTRFGAARRWERLAMDHGSLEASLERLKLVYDDWWRRWRVQEYDPILEVATQFARTNTIRYAAVIHSMHDLADMFNLRRELIVAVNGTALSAGLCAYYRHFGNYPASLHMTYAQFVRRSSEVDPYDRGYGPMMYILPGSRHPIDTPSGRLWIEPGNGILYSKGQNLSDGYAEEHTDDGRLGDIVVWPPVKALSRERGLID